MSQETLAPFKMTDRDPKGLKFMSIVSASYNKAGLTDEEAQKVNEASGLSKLIDDFIEKNRRINQFADEETSSNYTYPQDFQLLPVAEQVAKLKELFPELNGANLEIASGELPEWADDWAAIPRWDKVGSTYNDAVLLGLTKLGQSRKFYNYRDGQLSEKYLRQNERTIRMWQILCDQQAGYDILIVPIQWGIRHRGRSVRRARECFRADEFGLGVFATCCLLLTHPKRLQLWEQLHWDCAGDDYDWYADGRWAFCPRFYFCDGKVEFGALRVDNVDDYFGSASAFLGSAPDA